MNIFVELGAVFFFRPTEKLVFQGSCLIGAIRFDKSPKAGFFCPIATDAGGFDSFVRTSEAKFLALGYRATRTRSAKDVFKLDPSYVSKMN